MVFKERMRKHGLWRIAIGIDAMVKAVFTAEIRNLAFRGDSRSAKKDDIIASLNNLPVVCQLRSWYLASLVLARAVICRAIYLHWPVFPEHN